MRDQRIRHLVLDDLRCLSWVIAVDDHLRIGQVGDRVYRHRTQQPEASHEDEDRTQSNELASSDRPGDHVLDHGRLRDVSMPPMLSPIPICSMSP